MRRLAPSASEPTLEGRLESVDLLSLIRLLGQLRKTGRLDLTWEDWKGRISFDSGQVVAAVLQKHDGMAALEAMVVALRHGTFSYTETEDHLEHNLDAAPEALAARLAELAQRTKYPVTFRPRAIPRLLDSKQPNEE